MRIQSWGAALLVLGAMLGSGAQAANTPSSSAAPIAGSQTAPIPVPQPSAQAGISFTAYGGYTGSNDWNGGYLGVIVPINPQRSLDGLLLRADGLYGSSNYDISMGDAMIGYGTSAGPGWLSGFVGPAFETDSTHGSGPHGTKWGVKGSVEYDTPMSNQFRFSGLVSYASPYSNTLALARLGYQVGSTVHIGPEVSGIWRDGYREDDVGGFVDIDTRWGGLSVSGGYADPQSQGNKSGFYIGVDLGVAVH